MSATLPCVRLVAVSKTKPGPAVLAFYEAGQRHFGENYVQELVQKAAELPNDICWHFIGKLQSNKCKAVAQIANLWAVQSVHSVKLATALNKECAARRPAEAGKLRVFVQVNTSGEESKSGCEPEECVQVVSHVLRNCAALEFVGLMTIGKLGGDSTEDFSKLRECRATVCRELGLSEGSVELSMGMSGDFEKAVSMGSTSVRLGTTLFGARESRA